MSTAIINFNKVTKKEKKLGEIIDLILSLKSDNTKKTYINTYNDFSQYFFNKISYKLLTWENLLSLNYIDIIEYVKHLELSYKTSSIKSKLASLQFLSKELNKIKPNSINSSIFHIEIKNKDKENSYGALTKEEMNNLLEYCKSLDTRKYLFFKLMLATAHRVNSLLNLKWGDIKLIKENDKDIPIIEIYDKTNHFKTPISNELYNELKQNLYQGIDDNKIFYDINNMALCRILDKFCAKYNIDKKSRNIVVHSIKKTSGDIVYEKTNGDISATAKHLHHNNISTAYKHYIGKNISYTEQTSYTIFNDDNVNSVLLEKLNNLSKNDIIEYLLLLDDMTKNKILNNLKDIK